MSNKYRMTLTDLPPADVDGADPNNTWTPEITPPPGGAWKLTYSVRGEYKMIHHWVQGSTDFESGAETYWTGKGDDPATGAIGLGEAIKIEMQPGDTYRTYDVYLNQNIPTWLYGGQVVWENACGYVSAEIVATASPVQAVTNASLAINGAKVYYVGNGNGTHEFAGNPTLVKNLTGAGMWNYDETNGLLPAQGDGAYDIYTVEVVVSRFINHIWCYGTTNEYKEFKNTSAWKIPPGYVIRLRLEAEDRSSHPEIQGEMHAHMMLNLIRYTTV